MNTSLTINNLKISSKELTLKGIVDEDMVFNIPIYQRLYVWGEQQIRTLLGDLFRAFSDKKNENYYLGGIMLTENDNKLDLIDGQQRFTTLWLLSKVLDGELNNFIYTTVNKEQKSRISFSVREFANHYFNSKDSSAKLTVEEIKELEPISDAIELITNFIKDEVEEELKLEFSSFIYNRVMLVATKMPADTDENKVFEAMNNRGVQLQQHEILKSTLLSKLKGNRELLHKYGLLWDACSIMDNYLEKNIKLVADLKWNSLFPNGSAGDKNDSLPNDILSRLITVENKSSNQQLLSILKGSSEDNVNSNEKNNISSNEDGYEAESIRSIIDFPMLLLHTLRIYQHRYLKCKNPEESAEVKGKSLIKIFNSFDSYFKTEKNVIEFIDLLWNVRKQFDKYVIKWVGNDEDREEVHLIKRLYQSETSFQRRAPKKNEGFALLQSMLYHSQQIITHYWLTPFLNKMLDIDDKKQIYAYLKKLDNEMFCNRRRDLRTMSFKVMEKDITELNGNLEFVANTLNEKQGTAYPSYWFYKLEYILWLSRDSLNKKDSWSEYKMTAKNSVEHISPQNPKQEDVNIVYSKGDTEEKRIKKQNDFGNLVLLSPGMNSEYSNKTFNSKKVDYQDKKRLDSLKSDLIFSNEEWNWENCKKHRKKMIELFVNHLQN
ncbi:DUF262 domain-containing protein [Leeuwenhoekiella sp. NPDC079379]|uniref:DUF262 domain-containing protein n=1 Tax=Leeuwenhoekiella sp. NPDC079379 TaxID=3364122 RepID=UPI0037CBCA23